VSRQSATAARPVGGHATGSDPDDSRAGKSDTGVFMKQRNVDPQLQASIAD
jgi:hypothetical protein